MKLVFTKEDTIDSVTDKLSEAVRNGVISQSDADKIFEEAKEKLCLVEKKRINDLKTEIADLEIDKARVVDKKEQLEKEGKTDNLASFEEDIKKMDEKIEADYNEIVELNKTVKDAVESFDTEISDSKSDDNKKKTNNVISNDDELLDYQIGEAEKILKNKDSDEIQIKWAKDVMKRAEERDKNNKGDLIFTGTYPMDTLFGKTDEKREKEFRKRVLPLVYSQHPEYEKFENELVVVPGGDASEDGVTDGTANETFLVYRKQGQQKENKPEKHEDEDREFLCKGTYGMDTLLKKDNVEREKEFRKRILPLVYSQHPEYEKFEDELLIVPGGDASDDGLTDGTAQETYIVYRVRKNGKDKSNDKTVSEKLSDLKAEKEKAEKEKQAAEKEFDKYVIDLASKSGYDYDEMFLQATKEEIHRILSNQDVIIKIIKQKGVFDIYKKRKKDRTPEEQKKLQAVITDVFNEIIAEKREKEDTSVLDIIQVKYNIEGNVIAEVKNYKKATQLKNKKVKSLIKKKNKLPMAIQNNTKGRNATNEPVPDDMKAAMKSQKKDSGKNLVRIFEDSNGKKYVYNTFFRKDGDKIIDDSANKLSIDNPGKYYKVTENGLVEVPEDEITNNNRLLVEITDEEAKRIEDNADKSINPYYVEKNSIEDLINGKKAGNKTSNPGNSSAGTTDNKEETELVKVFPEDDSNLYYAQSDPNMTDEQIEEEMWKIYKDAYKKKHGQEPKITEDMTLMRGMGVDNSDDNTIEPFAVGKKVPKKNTKSDPTGNNSGNGNNGNNDDKDKGNGKDKTAAPKPTGKYVGRPAVDKVLGDLTDNLPNGIKTIGACEGERFLAATVSTGKTFFSELKSGGVDYNVTGKTPWAYKLVGALPMTLQHLISIPIRAMARFHFWRNPDLKEAMEEIQKRINELSEEELDVLFEDYRGPRVKAADNRPLNALLFPKLREHGLKKVEKLNNRMQEDYDNIFMRLSQIMEIEKKMVKTKNEEEFAKLKEAKDKIMYVASEHVKDYIECRNRANKILNDGIHGLSEDFKAVRSRMNYEGLLFSKGHELDTDLNAEIGNREQELNDAIALNDRDGIVKSFLRHQKLYHDNTVIESSIWGDRSVGKKSEQVLAQEMSYANDPFFRNLLTSVAIATTVAHTVDTLVKAHQAKDMVADYNKDIDDINSHNKDYESQVKDGTQKIIDSRGTVQKGIKGQIDQDTLNDINAQEIESLNKSGWAASSSSYRALDDATHLEYNKYHADLSERVQDVVSRGASGKLSEAETLHEMLKLGEESQDHLKGVLRKAWDVFEKYDQSHSFDHSAAIDSFKNILDNPNVVSELQRSAVEHIDIAETLNALGIQEAEHIANLPSDLLTMILADVGMVGLVGNATRELRDRVNNITKVEQERITNKYDEGELVDLYLNSEQNGDSKSSGKAR